MGTEIHDIDRLQPLNDVAVHQGRMVPSAAYFTDIDGNPTGGLTRGEGFEIDWQNGVKEPNGAILEDVLAAAIDRLEFFQNSRFACEENANAIGYINEALGALAARTAKRKAAGTEGTYKV